MLIIDIYAKLVCVLNHTKNAAKQNVQVIWVITHELLWET